jgi:glycosyltransferase involved in cell wall biosynthesis
MLSGAVPETRLAGSMLLYRLLPDYPPDRLLAIGPRPHPQSDLLACEYRHLKPAASGRLDLTRLAQLKRSFEALGLVGRIPMTRIEAAVGAFTPDVVLCVMERRDYVDAAHRYCQAHSVPLVLVVHDRVESFDLVYRPFQRAQIRRNAATYRYASARLCVSPEMVAVLAEVYGAPGTVLYPIRSDRLRPRPPAASAELVSPPTLTIGYCGGLGYGYGQRIRETAAALARGGAHVRIYSRDAFADTTGASYVGAFPADELWARVQRECDAVWLPYAYDDHHRQLDATHFPSKLTEYMALGMPVLISGPRHATGVKWGLAHAPAALTLANEGLPELEQAVRTLREDAGLRTTLARASREVDVDFEPAAIRQRFLDVLRSVAR